MNTRTKPPSDGPEQLVDGNETLATSVAIETDKPKPSNDDLLVHVYKLIQTTAGLSVALATLNFGINLGVYLGQRSAPHARILLRGLLGHSPKASPRPSQGVGTAGPAALSSLSALGGLLSDFRRTLRLTGLITLYLRLRSAWSDKTSGDGDPLIRRILLVQCAAHLVYQAIENVYHLHLKGILPPSIVNRHGGVTRWIACSCRAWTLAVLSDCVRLWREAHIARANWSDLSPYEQWTRRQKWWRELVVSALWLPVALHASFHPLGVAWMNAGTVAFASLLATSNNLAIQWQAAAGAG